MHNFLPLSLGHLLETNARRFRDVPAWVMGERSITHGELLIRARQLASALHNTGLRRQDRVGILSMNSLEYAETLAAAQYSGIIVATVNFRLAGPEMRYIINDATPEVLIFEAQYLPVIETLRSELPSVKTYVCIGGETEWAQNYEAFVASGDPAGPGFVATEDDIYCIVYTSGTTGKPKGCVWGHRETLAAGQICSGEMQTGPTDRILLVMPLFHVGAMWMGLAVSYRGGTCYLHRQYDPDHALDTIGRERITVLHFAPTMVHMLLESPKAASCDFSSVRTVVYSAAPMPTPLLRQAIKMFGRVFINLYGQSEVITSGLDRGLHHPDGTERERRWLSSVGHPFPNTLVRIVDDHGQDCPQGEPGEIVVKTVCMFRGYWNNSAATLNTIRDGWCFSGDMGRIDEDGILYLVDRKKDMIISGGENIYSREVEEAVLQHLAVSECAVIGQPDDKWGEVVCAVVVLKAGMSATEEELIDHAKTLIASYKKPKQVIFAKELPKLATGKINKIELRNLYTKKG
ncbi:MAG: long-chain-fatty-acid--CoA ligase [Rhodocyclaceae bacterium]|jgi:acyl-CoA synthetase (AMP-forming)/AMP-acid ligase II|nr:long-chain-fatty-acid--CoA ligase [Rhodocyclaceae bacterium]